MKSSENLCFVAMEECAEVSQRISKLARFGPYEVQPGQKLSNGERVMLEYADLDATIEEMQERGLLPVVQIDSWDLWKKVKRDKIKRYLAYSKKMGTVV